MQVLRGALVLLLLAMAGCTEGINREAQIVDSGAKVPIVETRPAPRDSAWTLTITVEGLDGMLALWESRYCSDGAPDAASGGSLLVVFPCVGGVGLPLSSAAAIPSGDGSDSGTVAPEGGTLSEMLALWEAHEKTAHVDDGVVAEVPDVPGAASARSFPEEVERWRELVSRYPWDVDEALTVMTGESRGDPSAWNGCCAGLFQLHAGTWAPYCGVTREELFIPEVNVWCASLVYQYDLDRGRPAWGQWQVRP